MTTVLVVDDDDDARQSWSMVLALQGWGVRTARDGGEAMAEMALASPDVILLDLMMPRISGWEFLDSKAASRWAAVPVVVLSGWSQTQQPIPASAGVAAVIEKGTSTTDVIARIEDVLRAGA